MPQTARGRHGPSACASQTSSGSSARPRSWPSVLGSSSSPNETATSPPTTIGRPPVSTTTACMPRVCPGARTTRSPSSKLELPVDRHVPHAGRVGPLADRVVVLRARVLELLPLNVNRPSGEQVVAATVVEVQVRVDDDVDAGGVKGLLAQRDEAGIHVC